MSTSQTLAEIELDHPMYRGRFRLVLGRYPNGRRSVSVVDESGDVCGSLTIDTPSIEIADDELLIDEWNEPSAIVRAAAATGVFVDTGRNGRHRLVNYAIWQLAKG